MIAADGGRSSIRETSGTSRKGGGHIRTARSVLFRVPLDEDPESGFSQFEIRQDGLEAFLATYKDGRWVPMFGDDMELEETALRKVIYQAIGRNDVNVEIVATGRWEITGLIADHFSSGRVFLVGDAVHTASNTWRIWCQRGN